MIGSGVYCATKGTIRSGNELLKTEKKTDCYFVYYPLENGFDLAAFIIPNNLDNYASTKNMKLAHCKAWFTNSESDYFTIEITSG
jgi:hypothetical protein